MNWPAEDVWQAVAPLVPGFTVEILPEVDSSNSELMRRARAGRLEPVLLVAQRQTAGRGRLGRAWHSAAGDSLTFSLGLPLAPVDWAGLSLAVGVSVAESLHPSLRLKWPNDLWLEDRKLGGILIETASFGGALTPTHGTPESEAFRGPRVTREREREQGGRYAVIGVGINIAARSDAELSTPAAALRELLPQAEAGTVLKQLAEPLVRDVLAFAAAGFAPFRTRFAVRDALHGRPVTLSNGTAGTARGVDGSGALLVHTAAGLQAVSSSEVSVRPAGP
jgi:BirA family biotin operon repressor/biotin-[acetyl-CoA-carboxylase] ligase